MVKKYSSTKKVVKSKNIDNRILSREKNKALRTLTETNLTLLLNYLHGKETKTSTMKKVYKTDFNVLSSSVDFDRWFEAIVRQAFQYGLLRDADFKSIKTSRKNKETKEISKETDKETKEWAKLSAEYLSNQGKNNGFQT